jgi:hypothetical protein
MSGTLREDQSTRFIADGINPHPANVENMVIS